MMPRTLLWLAVAATIVPLHARPIEIVAVAATIVPNARVAERG